MRLSLSARVAIGLTAQMVVFGGASAYLVWAFDQVFDDLSVVKDDLEPAVDDLKSLLVELKTAEDYLSTGRSTDVERIRGYLPRSRVMERLSSDLLAIRKTETWRDIGPDAVNDLQDAVAAIEELTQGDRLVPGALKTGAYTEPAQLPRSNVALYRDVLSRLDNAAAGARDNELLAMSRELLRQVRFIRSSVLRATTKSAAALREMNHDLFEQRSDISIALVLVPAGALVSALLLLLLSLRALRPVGELAAAVRRLATGDYSTPAPERLSREFDDLASALNTLASAIRVREEEILRNRDDLMRAERLAVVGRMASVVAHEVRNPLNSIALNVDLLRDMLQGIAGQRELDVVTAVQGEVDRLAEITEEYLRFGRLPKGVLAPCDAGRIVRDTVDFMAGELATHGVQADVKTPDPAVLVLSDESQLRQALVNILRNAIEAMPDGGSLVATVEPAGDRIALSVTDTGCGIPEEFRSRLFEPFATTKPSGTGLGLAFVQQVAHESGGDVAVESAPGRGTTVRLRLRRA